MRIRSFLVNLSIGMLTFAIGFAWFGLYQFFVPVRTAAEITTVENIPNISQLNPSADLKADREAIEEMEEAAQKATDATKEAARETAEEAFTTYSLSGTYKIDNSTFDKFSEFRELEFEFVGADSRRLDYLIGPPMGHFKSNQSFKYDKVLLVQRELFFSTNTVNGISYEFSGSFGFDPNDPSPGKEPVLIGALMKIRNGKIVKRLEITFRSVEKC